MQAVTLTLTLVLGALQLWPAVLGGPQHQRFAVLNKNWPTRLNKVQNFAWQNCGPSSDPAVIKNLNVNPDPLQIPGTLTVSASGATTVSLESPLKASVILEKRLGELWLKIPCVDQLGSCTYDDTCALLDSVIPPGIPCPEPLQTYGIPCHCPFKAGTYNLPPSQFEIPKLDLPSFFTDGDYKFTVVLSNGDQHLSCVKLSFSLRAESWWF